MMRCHVAVSQESDPQVAAQAVSQSVRQVTGESGCDLACVFFSPHFSFEVQSLLETIRQNLAPKIIIGCMGTGVIGGNHEIEEEPGLVLWGMNHPGAKIEPLTLSPRKDGEFLSLEGWPKVFPPTSSARTFLLFADPFSTPIDELFSLIDQHAAGSTAIGGIASGGTREGESQLVLNDKIIKSGVVGVAIQGAVEIRTVVSQGCQPIGERYVVTKVDRNVIQELGGVPPLERLEMTLKMLSEAERQQAASGLQIGIAMDEHRGEFGQGDFLIRGLLGADRQSGNLAIAEFVQEGQTIQFHVRDAQAAAEDLNGLLTQERMTNPRRIPRGVLLFSCHGRGQRFFETSHHDVAAVHRYLGPVPIGGFFAGGEIGPVGGGKIIYMAIRLVWRSFTMKPLRNHSPIVESQENTCIPIFFHRRMRMKVLKFEAGLRSPLSFGLLNLFVVFTLSVGLFLFSARADENKMVTTPSGLQYMDLVVGSGRVAQAGATAVVHYTGKLTDGKKFDSSKDRNQPFSFGLGGGRVIKGWDEGVEGMKIGGTRMLIIPPHLGYGSRGAGAAIPPNATLIFEVELLDLQ